MKRTHVAVATAAACTIAATGLFSPFGARLSHRIFAKEQSVVDALHSIEGRVEPLWRARWCAACGGAATGLEEALSGRSPATWTLIAHKKERTLDAWVSRSPGQVANRLHTFQVLAASGVAGPKLREGDKQVPEGVYSIASLNPNSRFHLSMKIDYPNSFDRRNADNEGRTDPGGDIFIHGGAKSIGCLAIGDGPIEELFWLVARAGPDNVRVMICPESRADDLWPVPEGAPQWTSDLYEELWRVLAPFDE